MALNPDIRASDSDRDRVAAALREHCALGRITMDELNERLEATYEAKTLGELQEVTSDLPEEDLYERPVPATSAHSSGLPARRGGMGGLRANSHVAWVTFAVVSWVNVVVWLVLLVTGTLSPEYWYAQLPWSAFLVVSTVFAVRTRRSG